MWGKGKSLVIREEEPPKAGAESVIPDLAVKKGFLPIFSSILKVINADKTRCRIEYIFFLVVGRPGNPRSRA